MAEAVALAMDVNLLELGDNDELWRIALAPLVEIFPLRSLTSLRKVGEEVLLNTDGVLPKNVFVQQCLEYLLDHPNDEVDAGPSNIETGGPDLVLTAFVPKNPTMSLIDLSTDEQLLPSVDTPITCQFDKRLFTALQQAHSGDPPPITCSSSSSPITPSPIVSPLSTPRQKTPDFFMFDAVRDVKAMFPDVEQQFLEDFLEKQPDDHANRVCNYLLEHDYPRELSGRTETPLPQKEPEKNYLADYKQLVSPKYREQCLPVLRNDFPKVSACSLRLIASKFNYHYSPTRQCIERCLKERWTKSAFGILQAESLAAMIPPPVNLPKNLSSILSSDPAEDVDSIIPQISDTLKAALTLVEQHLQQKGLKEMSLKTKLVQHRLRLSQAMRSLDTAIKVQNFFAVHEHTEQLTRHQAILDLKIKLQVKHLEESEPGPRPSDGRQNMHMQHSSVKPADQLERLQPKAEADTTQNPLHRDVGRRDLQGLADSVVSSLAQPLGRKLPIQSGAGALMDRKRRDVLKTLQAYLKEMRSFADEFETSKKLYKQEEDAGKSPSEVVVPRLELIGRKRRYTPIDGPMFKELEMEIEYYKRHLQLLVEEQDKELANQLNNEQYEEECQLIECGCCYDDIPFDHMVQCCEGHLFCEDCLCRYASEAAYGQGKAQLFCMSDGCASFFAISQLRKALPESVLSKYEERVQEESLALAQMVGLVKCPFCEFKALMAPEDKVFRCHNPSCSKESCRHCQNEWSEHFGKPCREVESKNETSFRTKVEEMMTEAKIRRCAACGTEFYKEEGCNRMTCRCGHTMCYLCRKPKIDYNHFCQHLREPGKPCSKCKACSLWTQPNADDELAMQEVRKEWRKRYRDETGVEFDKLIGAPDEPLAKRAKEAPIPT